MHSFGVIPTTPLPIHTPLMPNQNIDISLPLNTIGPVMKMDPLNNLQVGTQDRWCHLFFPFGVPHHSVPSPPYSTQLEIIQLVFLIITPDYVIIFPTPTCHRDSLVLSGIPIVIINAV